MFLMHPVCLFISLICVACYYVKLKGGKALWFMARYFLPLMIVTALINPAFNHRGMMILCYLPTGNPLTLENIIYGLAAAVMPVILVWFACYTEIMTSDKFVYLFGKKIPALSLVLSMTLVEYFLSTKLFCDECGSLMVGDSGTSRNGCKYNYYKCICMMTIRRS